MKILVLCYEFPPVGGGGGRVAAHVAAELSRRGHDVRVMTAGLKHLPASERVDGVEVTRVPSFRRREDTCTVLEMGLYVATSFLPVVREVWRWRPDVMHAHFAVPTGALALAVHAVTRCPYVITAHLGDVPGGVPEQTAGLFRLVDPAVRFIWKFAAGVTAVSTFVSGLAAKAYGITPRVILNGVRPLGKTSVAVQSPVRLLFAGRFSIQKNPLLAIEALALVRDLDWRLDFVGEGPLGDAMRRAVDQQGLSDRITFRGWLAGPDVSALMEQSDVLLMTSLHEGLPMVGVEALQHGLAIVASRIGGVLDLVEGGGNGRLCELDAASFAAGLREVLGDPERLRQMREASLRRAAAFDFAGSVSAYEEVLSDAARRNQASSDSK